MSYRILSLDGGGIRGVIQSEIIRCIEEDFNEPVYNLFDFFAGTSSGALISIYIAGCRANGQQCLDFFSPPNAARMMNLDFWGRLFPALTDPKYDGKGKSDYLKERFEDRRIQDVEKDLMVTAYDVEARDIVTFTSYPGKDSAYNPLLSEIADASSAAPTYFPTIETSEAPSRWLIDGGMAGHNPSMCALIEAMKKGHKFNKIKMLSLGSGFPGNGSKHIGPASQKWGPIGWINNNIIEHLFNGTSTAVVYQCQQLLKEKFLRINYELKGDTAIMDCIEPENIKELTMIGKQWYFENRDKIKELLKPKGMRWLKEKLK